MENWKDKDKRDYHNKIKRELDIIAIVEAGRDARVRKEKRLIYTFTLIMFIGLVALSGYTSIRMVSTGPMNPELVEFLEEQRVN